MEFDHLGAPCTSCGALDFLPLRCSGCHLSFCTQHGAQSAHSCPATPAPAAEPHASSAACEGAPSVAARPCTSCGARPLVGLVCSLCSAATCLAHRFDHGCAREAASSVVRHAWAGAPVVGPPGPHAQAHAGGGGGGGGVGVGVSVSGAVLGAVPSGALGPSGAGAPAGTRKVLSAKDAALARSIALMRLKARVPAADVRRVPEASRCFLEARDRDSGERVSLCVDASTSVGSLLDTVARGLAVVNNNGSTADEARRIHLYAEAADGWLTLLDFSERLVTIVARGMLASGSAVVLVRGLLP